MLYLEDKVLEGSDGHVAVDIKFVPINEGLGKQTEVSWLVVLAGFLASLLILLVLLGLDPIGNDLCFLGEDVKCRVCQNRHLHLYSLQLVSCSLFHFLNDFW